MIKRRLGVHNLARRGTDAFAALRRELPKRSLDVLFSAAGFLLALGVNSWIGERHDRDAYQSMIKAVQTEAASNQAILEKSYGGLFDRGGLILKDFSVVVVSQALANPLFVSHAKASELSLLNEYARNVTLANSYRQATETVTFSVIPAEDRETWLNAIKEQWRSTVGEVERNISRVLTVGDTRPGTVEKTGARDSFAARAKTDSVRIVSISPGTDSILRAGRRITITAEVEYSLVTADSGWMNMVVQNAGSHGVPLVGKDEVVTRGAGTLILTRDVTVPDASRLQVFTPLYVRGASETSIADLRSYKIGKPGSPQVPAHRDPSRSEPRR